jgi:hypothetical protein
MITINQDQAEYDNEVKDDAGQSFLHTRVLSGAANFKLTGTDRHGHAQRDLAVFRPVVPSEYYYLGEVAAPNHDQNYSGSCIIVQPMNDDPDNPCLKSVTHFVQIWNDHGSGASMDLSFWQPNCSDPNYVPIGFVFKAAKDYNPPSLSDYPNLVLVRSDLVNPVKCDPSSLIWDDRGSGAKANASLFALPRSNYFICSTGAEGVVPAGTYPDIILQ